MTEEKGRNKYNNPLAAILTGIGDLFRKPKNGLILGEDHRLDGLKAVITGASSGLGLATAVELARRGAMVIMAVRSGIPDKGEEVKKRSGSDQVAMIPLDLADLESVRSFPRRCMEQFGEVDVFISNAAMVAKNSRQILPGLDEMFLVNYLAKFILINGIIGENCLNTRGDRLPRIIFVASESHRNPGHFHWEEFGTYVPYGIKKSVYMYGYYKLLLVTMANELSRRLNPGPGSPDRPGRIHVPVAALCPGPVNSNIAREIPRAFRPLLRLVFRLFFRSPEKACKPVVYLACSEEHGSLPMDYLFLMQRKAMDPRAEDPENGKRLWEMSEELSLRS